MDYFLGEIRLFPYGHRVPQDWHLCDGALLPINQYQALYSLLGTQFGGNGTTNFALPNLKGNCAIGAGQGPNLTYRPQAQTVGSTTVQLTASQIPPHTHQARAAAVNGDQTTASTAVLPAQAGVSGKGGSSPVPIYSTQTPNTTMGAGMISTTGGNQAHQNMQPYTVVDFYISLTGIYPSRS